MKIEEIEMCRLVFYRGAPISMSSLITEPTHSVIRQSYRSKEREEPLNGDGFGVGWYTPELSSTPAVFRDVSPAWNNQNLANLAPVIYSPCIVAHIRAASPGLPVTQLNCHPFVWGKLTFAHNGVIGGFHRIRRTMQRSLSDDAFRSLHGSTDSEHLFAMFIDEYAQSTAETEVERMAQALDNTIRRLNEIKREAGIHDPALLNLILTDGDSTIVTRYISSDSARPESLYVHSGSSYECKEGVCRMVAPAEDARAVLVASEPLSQDEGWSAVGANTMLLIDETLDVAERPMNLH